MTEKIETRILSNGLVLLTEQIAETEAAAYSFRIPYGTVDEPADRPGLAEMITEMIVRGAGEYDNRQLLSAFENLGIDGSESAHQAFSAFSAVLVADQLNDSLALTADVLRRPRFPEEELEPARQVLLQELAGLEDDPSRILARRLGKIFYPAPWGRPASGEIEGIQAITLEDVVETYKRHYSPNGAVLSIAGKIDPGAVAERVESLFGDWTGPRRELPAGEKSSELRVHIPFSSAQTHIGLAWPSVPANHDDYLPLRCGFGVLSGGMSCRLFDEVREKRGLCYSVSASYTGNQLFGAGLCYCASGADTAQEALDVILSELRRLSEKGVTQTELDRCKIRLKSLLVMMQESTVAHAEQMASDYHIFGRVRFLHEYLDQLDALTLDRVNETISAYRIGPFRLVTLGPEELKIDPALLG